MANLNISITKYDLKQVKNIITIMYDTLRDIVSEDNRAALDKMNEVLHKKLHLDDAE